MNTVCVSTTFTADQSPLKHALQLCEKSEIDVVEIGSNHCHEPDYSYVTNYHFEYLVHNYFPVPTKGFIVNLASLDDTIHRKSLKHVKVALDFCSGIGAKLYTFHPGFLSDPQGVNPTNQNYDFQWGSNHLEESSYEKAWEQMVRAIREIVDYAQKKRVRVAFETQGSYSKKEHLLMQRPVEFERLLTQFSPEDLGINLNIGHLNLAANAFDFSRDTFVDMIFDYMVAMELSHNDGFEDQHLPLKTDGWYWDLIQDSRFENVFKILEFRNTPISEIKNNIQLIMELRRY